MQSAAAALLALVLAGPTYGPPAPPIPDTPPAHITASFESQESEPQAEDQVLATKIAAPAPSSDVAAWQPTVDCECSGDWLCAHATTYLYGLQFHPDTWASHGGLEFGSQPTPAEQVIVAWRVLASHESDPWPNCPDPGD